MEGSPVLPPSSAPTPTPPWQRTVSRRVVLGAAAAGALTAAVAALWRGGVAGRVLDQVRELTHGSQEVFPNERVRLAHLLRRAGFGASPQELDRQVAIGAKAVTKALLDYEQISTADLDSRLSGADTSKPVGLQSWWLQRMVQSPRPLEEKMTLFWHGLLTSGLDKAGPLQLHRQNQLLRRMALGNFDDLLKAVSKDPAMMLYLDTASNRKGAPNENYARELMELFTTGIGQYTEEDVKESARAFTGWTLEGGRAREATASAFAPRLHDDGLKSFMGKTGRFTGDDIVDMLVPLRATAERLSARLFSFFTYPSPEPAIVKHLADVFQANRYSVKAVVREILTMDAFYSPRAYRALIKSPAEYVVQTLRSGVFAGSPDFAVDATNRMGQVLFFPPNVAGWPSGASWISSSTLLTRINFANAAAQKIQSQFREMSLDQVLTGVVDGAVSPSTRDALERFQTEHAGNRTALLFLVLATPEHQLN